MRICLTLAASLSLALPAAAEAPLYPTPQDALDALVAALQSEEPGAVLDAMDPEAGDLIEDPDDAEGAALRAQLLGLWQEGWRFVPSEDGRVTIELGADDWPFPVPLARQGEGWVYDTEEGREAILQRQIGFAELDVIAALEGYVALQAEYRSADRNGDGVLEFAAHLISEEGTRDGLYWDGPDSLIGDAAARASLDGFSSDGGDTEPEPFLGYYFRLLTAQGADAPGGEMSYMVNGHMLGGHALLAVPAEYGETGLHSFMVGEAGVIYEADLGPESIERGFEIIEFNPGDDWAPIP